MLDDRLRQTLREVARFYDRRKVGDVGSLGFRRSTDLSKMVSCLAPLIQREILFPGQSLFLDMGCADGRVNVLLSYLLKKSVGVELGGLVQYVRRELEVLCLPTAIPEAIEVDISDLDIGDSIHVEDISLEGDVEIPADTNFTVVTVLAPKVEEVVEEEELVEGEELEEGEEAAEEEAGEEAPSEEAKED